MKCNGQEIQNLHTSAAMIYSLCHRWQTEKNSKEQENTQHISHAANLQNTVEILMPYFNVLKSLHTVCLSIAELSQYPTSLLFYSQVRLEW